MPQPEQAKHEANTINWVNNLKGTPSLDSKGADAVVPEEGQTVMVHGKISPKVSAIQVSAEQGPRGKGSPQPYVT